MAQALKRSFPHEITNGSICIDLTSDNEDTRPPKRQRSESYTAPKVPAHNSPLAAHTVRGPSPKKPSLINGTSSTQVPVKRDIGNSFGKFASRQRSPELPTITVTSSRLLTLNHNGSSHVMVALNGAAPSGTPTSPPKKRLSQTMSGLTLRPSPGPQIIKLSRSPDVIDLETDSDRAMEKFKRNDLSRKSTSSPYVSYKSEQVGSTISRLQNIPSSKPGHVIGHPLRKPFVPGPSTSGIGANITPYQSKQLLKPETFPPPTRKAEVRVDVPPTPKETATRLRDVVRLMKDDVGYIEMNAQQVFDVTGVRPFENKDLTKALYQKARQEKRQPVVDRSKVLLDLGSPSVQPITTERTAFVHPRKQTRSILNERFQGQGQAPITFENRVNDRRIHGKFQFVSDYVFSRKVQTKAQTPHLHRSCSCIDGICGHDCNCLIGQSTIKVGDTDQIINIRSYQRHREREDLIILSDELIEDTTHSLKIFECGDFCRCSKDCINRVVQKGRSIPLQIFETGKYGFGVRSSAPILRGQFIDIYLGEVLTELELSRREAAAEEDTPSYVMSLDAFITDDKQMFHIDGQNFGSVTRFVNHSCDPNCKIIPVVLPKGTKHVYYVAFFAVKEIPAGTELTIDYDPSLLHGEQDIDDGIVLCGCGSAKCRERLWAPGKEKRGRKRFRPSKDDD